MRKFILFLFALLCLGSMMTVKADTYKIYIHDQTGWNNGRALYCWGSGEHLGSWPGTTTYTSENVGGVDFIVFTVNENVIDQNLIFNNNNNGQQINLPTLSARDYYLNVTSSSVTVLGVILKGGFNGWDNSDVFTDNGETATLARNINAGTYEFKITIDGDWRSNNTTIKRADSGTEYDFSGNPSNNAKLEADITGDYTFTWTYATNTLTVTYPDLPTYMVSFDGLASQLYRGDVVIFNATSAGVAHPTYTYYVKKGTGEFGDAVTSYTFDDTGSYTVKVEVRENGAGEVLATAMQTVAVDDPLTLYFVNKDAWANVNIYFFNPAKTDWPGDAMTATGEETEGHNYAVYSYTVPESVYSSAKVIFNNGSGTQTADLSVNAKHYYFDGEWYATLAEIDPATFVEFDGVAATVLVNTPLTLAATSNVTNPGYRYYVKPEGGEFVAITSPHTFTTIGKYTLKVEALENNTGDPVASREKDIEVYITHTFNSGTRIYVDFSAMTEGSKKVNYPFGHVADPSDPLAYDENGAGTVKTVVFTENVTWSTLNDFIKTDKAGWTGLKFTVPAAGQNWVKVAADGASYTWDTYTPSEYYFKNKWDNNEWTWQQATAAVDGTFRLENVIFGGSGVNYNTAASDEGASWKEYTKIKYMDGAQEKVVSVYDTINLVLDPANDTIWAEIVKKEKVVFTVAGNSLALFDLGWAPTHPHKYTDMTKQADGTYKWDNGGQEVTLPAGWIELKVIKNRAYANGSWPQNENFAYEIKRSGEYDIAIHFNPYTETIWIDTLLNTPLNIQALKIAGSWDWAAVTPFTIGGDNDKSLVTLSRAAGNYEFKLVDGQNKWYGDAQAFTRENPSICGVVQTEGGANMTINIDKAGDYLFTYLFETEQLLVMYPANVPDVKIAPLSGKFTINSKGDTAIFARGNLQYNYEASKWYAAEKQYEVLGDLNLRFGDASYQGSIDMFGWSCESSNYGIQWKYKDEDFNGAFVDWGELFDGDAKEWSTLSEAEWNFIMNRTKGGKKLWTMIAIGSDSLNGLALLPDDWEAPACASDLVYAFYDVDDKVNYKKNSFTFAEWAELEASGVVFLPLAGTRAGFWGNNWTGAEETDLSNPLSSGYDWVDNMNWMGYYWLSTSKNTTQAATAILPGWHNYKWNVPTIWSREKRRGQPVRLVTRIPKDEHVVVRDNLNAGHYYTICYPKAMTDVQGATLWSFIGKDTEFAYIEQETASTIEAGKPYILYATASTVQAILGDETDAPGANGAIHGTFSNLVQEQLDNLAIVAGSDLYLVIGDELRRATGAGTGGNSLPANRAFVVVADIHNGTPNSAPGRNIRSMPMQKEETQGFENIGTSEKPMKMIIDGQLYILRGEKMYDATGRMIK